MTSALEQLILDSRRLSVGAKRAYIVGIRDFVQFAPNASTWTPATVEQWAKHLVKRGMAPQSANAYLAGLKTATRRAAKLGIGTDFASPIEGFRVHKAVREPRALTRAEAAKLLATTSRGAWADRRDRAILLVALRGGLRRSEIAGLRWSGLEKNKITFVGKGERQGDVVELDGPTMAALASWRRCTRAADTDFMFVRARPPLEGAPPKAITSNGIYLIVKRRADAAGLTVAPHELRHTCASLLLLAGVEPWRVQQHLRHRGNFGSLLGPMTGRYAHNMQGPPGDALGEL